MLTFRDLWVPVQKRIGDATDGAIDDAKRYINEVAREMAQRATWPHLCDEQQFKTVAAYSTGTVTVTQYSQTVAGAGTAWTTDMCGATFHLDGVEIRYKVKSVESATSLTLEIPYKGSTAATQSYELIFDEYRLEHDTIGILRCNLPEEDRLLTPGDMQKYYDIRLAIETAACPVAYFAVGATRWPYYETGTVTVTNGSTTVTGSGTTWDDTMIGKTIRIKDDMPRRLYRISARGSATSLTLENAYRGMGGDSFEYEIEPAGVPLMKLYPQPDDAYHVYYYRKRAPAEIFEDDAAISDWPEEFADTLKYGAMARALAEKGEAQLAAVEQARYEKALGVRISENAITDPEIDRQVGMWGAVPRISSFPGNYPVRLR